MMERHTVPSWGEDTKEKEDRPIINAQERRRRKKSAPLEAELDLSGELPMENMLKSGLEGGKKHILFRLGILNSKNIWKRMGNYQIMTSSRCMFWELIQI